MRNPLLIITLWLGFALISPAAQTASVTLPPNALKPYRLDRILIQPKPGVGLATLGRFHSEHRSRVLRTFKHIRNLQILEVPPGETAESLIARYQQSGLVEFAEPDYTGQLFSTTPNDPKFLDGTLWGLNTNSAPQAWDVLTSASNIVVAVLDTGVRYTHEDLAANMWTNPHDGSHGWNAINNNNDPSDTSFSGHGTLVAGVLGATGNNGKGVCGVAWRLQMMACICFDNFGNGNISDVITCLEFARTNGAKIINASWGFTNSIALSNAMTTLRNAGIIVIAACGNSTNDIDLNPTFPAGYPLDNIVSVASTSKADALSSFSNYGLTNVALAAPGEQIYSTWAPTDSFYSTGSGTSFSAPYVAGACALLMAQYPADNYKDIITRLLGATDPLPSLAGKCRTGGRLDLAKILRTIRVASIPATNSSPFQLRVSGGLNRTCVVEDSTNLMSWSPVFTNSTSTNGTFDFIEGSTSNSPARFFRATAAQ